MSKRQQTGFAELMIVNPVRSGSGSILLGDDGVFYHIQGFGPVEESPQKGRFFMGDDGSLYRLQGLGGNSQSRLVRISPTDLAGELGVGYGRFFLGEDGALYEIT
jgi:hypothetical protein